MPTLTNYRDAWLSKASIDYFAPFISLWLACNSWYRSHYSDLTQPNNPDKEGTDRDFINKLKTNFAKFDVEYELLTTSTPFDIALFSFLKKRTRLL